MHSNFLWPELFVETCNSAQGQYDFSLLDFWNLDIYFAQIVSQRR